MSPEQEATLLSVRMTILRTGIKRVAQATGDPYILDSIPAGDEFNGLSYEERGWNRLLARLCEWAEQRKTKERDRDLDAWGRAMDRAIGAYNQQKRDKE